MVGLFGVCGIYAGTFWYFIPLKCGCHAEGEKIYSFCGERERGREKEAGVALEMTPVIVLLLKVTAIMNPPGFIYLFLYSYSFLYSFTLALSKLETTTRELHPGRFAMLGNM